VLLPVLGSNQAPDQIKNKMKTITAADILTGSVNIPTGPFGNRQTMKEAAADTRCSAWMKKRQDAYNSFGPGEEIARAAAVELIDKEFHS
jgi:hypothetical protein